MRTLLWNSASSQLFFSVYSFDTATNMVQIEKLLTQTMVHRAKKQILLYAYFELDNSRWKKRGNERKIYNMYKHENNEIGAGAYNTLTHNVMRTNKKQQRICVFFYCISNINSFFLSIQALYRQMHKTLTSFNILNKKQRVPKTWMLQISINSKWNRSINQWI